MTTSILDNLSTEQRAAVASRAKTTIVTACAGSGKTRVVVARVVWYLRVRGIPAASILVFAFTRSAAHEIRARVRAEVGDAMAALVDITTFHSFAVRVLREIGRGEDWPESWRIADEIECREYVDRAFIGADRRPEASKTSATAVRAAFMRYAADGDWPMGESAACPASILDRMHRNGLVHQAEIIPSAVLVMQSDPLSIMKRRYFAAIVDEAQDATPNEWRIVRNSGASEITAVGDDAQRIFGWRGAVGIGGLPLSTDAMQYPLARSYRVPMVVAEYAKDCVPSADLVPTPWIGRLVQDAEYGHLGEYVHNFGRACGPSNVAVLCRTNFDVDRAAAVLGPDMAQVVRRTPDLALRRGIAALRLAMSAGDDASARIVLEHAIGGSEVERIDRLRGCATTLWSAYQRDHRIAGIKDVVTCPMDVAGPDAKAAIDAAIGAPWGDKPANEILDALTEREDDDTFAEVAANGKVAIATVHTAKGREWRSVIMVDWRDRDDEDRRVRYVAATRASESLIVVSPDTSFGPAIGR